MNIFKDTIQEFGSKTSNYKGITFIHIDKIKLNFTCCMFKLPFKIVFNFTPCYLKSLQRV